ncbi:MAG: helix-turn-helix transcriptional regulator [Marinibacterium sp.]|nr:helix-turn-helix transcriptional regulator [Marinibacterium sp.]
MTQPPTDPVAQSLGRAILAIATPGFAACLQTYVAGVCGFDNIAIIAFPAHGRPSVLHTDAKDRRVFDRIDSHYISGAYLLDPFFDLHKKQADQGLYRLSEIAPDQFQRNEYFKSYYARTTLTDEMAFLARTGTGLSITTCVGRDATTASRFSARDIRAAHTIAPVVNALVAQNWRDLEPGDGAPPSGDTDVAAALRDRLGRARDIHLSARQSDVALLILQGHSSISIGLTLGISPQTVKVIRKQLYKKCRISSQGELYYLIAPYL